jgi:signal transduction histidine kinase
VKTLDRLAASLVDERDTLLRRWRARVRELPSARHLDMPTLNDHIPGWIAELAASLRAASARTDIDPGHTQATPLAHGTQRFEDGFDIEEVVAEYAILRDCVHDMAEGLEESLRGVARRVIDVAFDQAIGNAVKAFAESQAREMQRRRAEHLAFVAHDLRTPLSAITFSAHLLQARAQSRPGDPETERLLRTLARNAKQLDALVSHVLKENTQLLTELGVKLERRRFDLWPLVEVLIQDLQPLAAKAGTRVVNAIPEEIAACADAGLVRRIMQNLVANALEYAPGGEVTIGARDLGDADAVECWVADNGAGIAPERLSKVFDALETDPQRDGVGLGLAIVKTFVEAHHGTVTVESVLGQGATFRFTLPRRVPQPQEGALAAPLGLPSSLAVKP